MDKNKLYFAVFLLWNFTAIFVFMASLHNVDLGFNFKDSIDCNSFSCETMEQRYSWGLDGMIYAFGMIITEIILFSGKIFLPKSL
jgi:hypothetical protein